MIGLSGASILRPVPGLRLANTSAPQKYGRVVVRNLDGTFNREIALTQAQYAALSQAGAGAPAGVTQQEWQNGQAQAFGMDFSPGDAKVLNGNLLLMSEQRTVSGQTSEVILVFRSGEWTGTFPNVTATAAALASLPANKRPLSLSSGILVR